MTFMCLLNRTDQGAKNIKDVPHRYAATKEQIEKLGGRLLSAYITTGQYDLVLIADMPSGEAMTKFAITSTSAGFVRTTTARAFAPEEFGKLIAEAL
jgi:uncharacterized protein with GYD domain